jgi:hypothetical protein
MTGWLDLNMEQTVFNISCEKMSVDQLSMMGVAELKSNSHSSCSSMSKDKPSKMSVAELQIYDHNGMVGRYTVKNSIFSRGSFPL